MVLVSGTRRFGATRCWRGNRLQGLEANALVICNPGCPRPCWTGHPLLADTYSQKSWKGCHMNIILLAKAIYEVSFPLPSSICSFLPSWTLTAPPNIWSHTVIQIAEMIQIWGQGKNPHVHTHLTRGKQKLGNRAGCFPYSTSNNFSELVCTASPQTSEWAVNYATGSDTSSQA